MYISKASEAVNNFKRLQRVKAKKEELRTNT